MSEAASGKLPLHWKMLIGFLAGLVFGLAVHAGAGADAGWVEWITSHVTQPAGTLFLRLIFMLVIPLLFSALVVGVAEMGDVRALGRIGWKTLAYTVVVSGIAVLIGLVLVNWLRPGAGTASVTRTDRGSWPSSASPPRTTVSSSESCCRSWRAGALGATSSSARSTIFGTSRINATLPSPRIVEPESSTMSL